MLSKRAVQEVSAGLAMAFSAMRRTSLLAVRAHSSLGMATLWPFLRGVSASEICVAASWATPHTFMTHYCLNVTVPSLAQMSVGNTE